MGNNITKKLLGLAVAAVLIFTVLPSLPVALADKDKDEDKEKHKDKHDKGKDRDRDDSDNYNYDDDNDKEKVNHVVCTGADLTGTLDNVIVPKGATCVLVSGVLVKGNVKIEVGANFQAVETYIGSLYADGVANMALQGVTVEGNIEVKGAGDIGLSGVTVEGNVHVNGAMSIDFSDVTVKGNIETNETLNVVLSDVTVEGNVQIKKTTVLGNVYISWSMIDGNVEIERQNGGYIEFTGSQVGGNVKLTKNHTILESPPILDGNNIGGNLECEKNSPAPVPGSPNIVVGKKKGQCSAAAGF